MSLPRFIADPDPSIYLSDNYLVLDFEVDTSHGDYGHARHPENQLLLACWKWRGSKVRAHWGNELEQQWLLDAGNFADFIVAHASKYELGWLKRMGVDLRKVLPFDTQLAEYVLLGNLAAGNKKLGMKPLKTSLDMCCRRRGLPIKDPVVDTMIKNGINPVYIPRTWLQGRCEQDVVTTEQVFLSQRTELQRRGLLPVLFTRCLLTPVLADIEQEGMALDPEAVAEEYVKAFTRHEALRQELAEMTGGINVNSPKQLAEFIYETLGFAPLLTRHGKVKTTESGQLPTDVDTLEALVARTDKQRKFRELYAELGKLDALLSKNLEFFRGVCEEYGGEFYGEIHQTRTATHRTSSTGVPLVFKNQGDTERSVQFQNTPRTLKRLFRAKREGWLMADPDCSQVEFRCAAVLGDDAVAIADIKNPDFDAHVQTASVMHNATKEEVLAEKKAASAEGRDDWRQLAKPDTYKPLYGGRYGSPEQEKYYKWFREHYSGISHAQDQWVEEALDTKRQVTPWGLTYYWPHAKRRSDGRVNCETAVDNYPIQALATAEIAPIGVVYLWHRLADEGLDEHVRIVNIVHDSAPCEIAPVFVVVHKFTQLVKQAFTADVYQYLEQVYGFIFDKVPLGVGLKIGTHWGQGPEQSWDIYRDGTEIKRK